MARDFVSRCLGTHSRDRYRPAVILVVSELCANAVIHAQTAFTVCLQEREDVLLLEVRDGALALARPAAAGEQDVHGRGLQIVQAFSSSWGVWPRRDGKSVWATFTIGPGEPPPADVYGW